MINTGPVITNLRSEQAFTAFAMQSASVVQSSVMPKSLARTALASDVIAWFLMKLAVECLVLRGSYHMALGKTAASRGPRWLVPILKPVQQKLWAVLAHRPKELTNFVRSATGFMDGWVLYEAGLRYRKATRPGSQDAGHHGFNDRVLDILVTERVEILAIKLFEALNTAPQVFTLDERYLQKARCLLQETGASVFAGLLVMGAALRQPSLPPVDAFTLDAKSKM